MMQFCTIVSGSSGNCIFVSTDDTKILIDAGISGKKVVEGLRKIGERPEELSAIFVTHEHDDHILGAGVLSRKFNLPIYANELTWREMTVPLKKIKPENRKTFEPGEIITLGQTEIIPFSLPHDAVNPNGYVVKNGNRKFTLATDIGHITDEVRAHAINSNAIVLEANHDIKMLKEGSYPLALQNRILSDYGHLSNKASGEFLVDLVRSGTTNITLGHLSEKNNTPDIAFNTVKNILGENGIKVDRDLDLKIAPRYNVGELCEV